MKEVETITSEQIREIFARCKGRYEDREERLLYIGGIVGRDVESVKELTQEEAEAMIRTLRYGEDMSYFGYFDKGNRQHMSVVGCCYKLGWVKAGKADVDRLGRFLMSKHSPVRKRLMEMNPREVSRVIYVLQKIEGYER